MTEENLQKIKDSSFDVVIAGGGLAGLTLAKQLKSEQPDRSVLVIEKQTRPLPTAAHKVGESSVELGSQYLERIGLADYLKDKHLFKFGLRFFPGGGDLPIEERCEIGPSAEPVVPSYQIDRGIFENDIRDMVTSEGVQLIEGARVRETELGKGETPHTITVQANDGDAQATIKARWFVDATGRTALLRKRLKLTRGSNHEAHASWFRVDQKVDITNFAPSEATDWHNVATASDRWRSTNHMMGVGYWVWIIPLSSGKTSIGVVVHDELHDFESINTLEKSLAFVAKHEPVVAQALDGIPVLDFGCYKSYSYSIGRCFSPDRWAAVGEAGAFPDPLYSPGTDFIGFANSFTAELIRADFAGEDLKRRCVELNVQYRSLVTGTVDLFRNAAPVYAHARAMRTKIYYDNFSYWSFPCQYFLQNIFRLTGPQHAAFANMGQRFVELSSYVQAMMRSWALLAPEKAQPGFAPVPAFPSILIDTHMALQHKMTPEETLNYIKERAAEAEELVGELLLRLCYELGAETAQAMFDELGARQWNIRIASARLEAEPTIGLARRRALSPIARDVERSFGRVTKSANDDQVREIIAPLLTPAGQLSAAAADAPPRVEA